MKLQIFDAQHNLVHEYTTTPDDYDHAPPNVPEYWFKSNPSLTNKAGINRFVWDLRYPAPKALRYGYFGGALDYIEYTLADHAVPGETPRQFPVGALAVPGNYTVELTVAGKTFTQPLVINMDPNVHVSTADLQAQLDTERNIAAQMSATYTGTTQLNAVKSAIDARKKELPATPAPVTILRQDRTNSLRQLPAQRRARTRKKTTTQRITMPTPTLTLPNAADNSQPKKPSPLTHSPRSMSPWSNSATATNASKASA